MKKNTFVVVLGMIMVLAVQVLAAPSASFSTGFANKYIAFGSGSELYGKAVNQTDFNVAFENGVYVDLWGSKALNAGSWGSNFGDEVDYGIGWAGKIGNGFSLNAGVTYFDEPMAGTFGECDVWYTHVKVSHDLELNGLGTFNAFGAYENYTTMPGTSYEGGNIWSVGLSKTQSYKDLSVNASEVLIYDEGAFGNDRGLLAKFGLELDWKVTKHVTLVAPSVTFYVPVTVSDSRNNELVVYGGVSVN